MARTVGPSEQLARVSQVALTVRDPEKWHLDLNLNH